MAIIPFGGITILAGSSSKEAVTEIQAALNAVGCGPVDVDGHFGAETFAAIEHFQARSVDANGVPLDIDGKVGPSTWAVLFGQDTVPVVPVGSAPSLLLKQVLTSAAGEVGVMEVPPNSNRGPRVDEYIRSTGNNPAGNLAWCACFVYFCFKSASDSLQISNPCAQTAGVLDHWARANTASARRILSVEAGAQPSLIVPGTILAISAQPLEKV